MRLPIVLDRMFLRMQLYQLRHFQYAPIQEITLSGSFAVKSLIAIGSELKSTLVTPADLNFEIAEAALS